jgi:glycerol-3-phosphate dehydrogenase
MMTSALSQNLQQTRQQKLKRIAEQSDWDLIIIGGGITGAGILKLASQSGLKALLLEQKDFAWGSSSRSSKMVHGGLRYIAEGQVKLTRESVHERQRLLRGAQGLVNKQSFVFSHYAGQFPWPWIFNLLLWIYDRFAGKKQHRFCSKEIYPYLVPGIELKNSIGGTQFVDAMTDDARLVLRLIQEAQQKDAQAINYTQVTKLMKEKGRVVGVIACPQENQQSLNLNLKLKAKVVVNATGAWSNELLAKSEQSVQLRPLRGSHLIVASWRLPVASAISVAHPQDKRPVQIFPWHNVTVIGTTDVEHLHCLSSEPRISQSEYDYLLACVAHQFPAAKLTDKDIISTFAGVRPVIDSGTSVAPSKEKREHSLWRKDGLIGVAGGKLTTFHLIAKQVLSQVIEEIQSNEKTTIAESELPVFESCEEQNPNHLPIQVYQHITAYYGQLSNEFIRQAGQFIRQTEHQLLRPIGYSKNLWAELIWAVKYEQVVHLDDLLLRRTRVGNVLPEGGLNEIQKIKRLCFKFLPWDEEQWQQEIERYRCIWMSCYSLPER